MVRKRRAGGRFREVLAFERLLARVLRFWGSWVVFRGKFSEVEVVINGIGLVKSLSVMLYISR